MPKFFLMKKFLLIAGVIILAIILILGWKFIFPEKRDKDGPKPEGLVVSKHSETFNQSAGKMLDDYYMLTEALVNWDTAGVNKYAAGLKTSIDSLRVPEMQKDSAIYPTVVGQWEIVKTEIAGLLADESLQEKRESFNMLSQQMFDLLRVIKYDSAKVYFQECPMALNNYETAAFWLSKAGGDDQRRNPYLGLHDPRYGKGMLKCGSTKDSVSFVSGGH